MGVHGGWKKSLILLLLPPRWNNLRIDFEFQSKSLNAKIFTFSYQAEEKLLDLHFSVY